MYEVKRYPYELDESYEMRKLFVSKYNPMTEEEFAESLRLALIWVNFKFLHCIYPIEIMNEIQTILEKGRVKKMKIRIKKKDIKE